MATTYLNKGRQKIIFPDDGELDITAFDMGEAGLNFGQTGETTTQIAGATRHIVSANLYVPSTLTVEVLKTSASADVWKRRVSENSVVNGTAVATDDSGSEFTYVSPSISMNEFSGNGTQSSYTFTLTGYRLINQSLA